MNRYEKIQHRKYTRMASITLVEYKKVLAEKEVIEALLESNADEYERLIDDIQNHNQININGDWYEVNKIERIK